MRIVREYDDEQRHRVSPTLKVIVNVNLVREITVHQNIDQATKLKQRHLDKVNLKSLLKSYTITHPKKFGSLFSFYLTRL